MNRKKLIIIGCIAIVVAGVIAAGAWFWTAKTRGTIIEPLGQQGLVSEGTGELVVWNDPAGFTFQYPGNLSVNKHDEDQENYAHVELTDPKHPGSIIIWAKDTTAADSNAWVKTEKTYSAASVLDSTLGNQPAKKVLLTSPEKKIVIGTIYDELLFSIEATLDEGDFWSGITQGIVDSFAFTPVSGVDSSGEDGEAIGEEPVDEEEVLE